MPPRTTQKSHRPRVSDRTMVGNCHPLLASAKNAAGRTQKNMTPRTSHKGEKQNHALEKCIAAANRGWMSEKYLPPAGQEKCFFLTSPFIEPGCFSTFRGVFCDFANFGSQVLRFPIFEDVFHEAVNWLQVAYTGEFLPSISEYGITKGKIITLVAWEGELYLQSKVGNSYLFCLLP